MKYDRAVLSSNITLIGSFGTCFVAIKFSNSGSDSDSGSYEKRNFDNGTIDICTDPWRKKSLTLQNFQFLIQGKKLKGTIPRENGRGKVVRVVWVKHQTLNG